MLRQKHTERAFYILVLVPFILLVSQTLFKLIPKLTTGLYEIFRIRIPMGLVVIDRLLSSEAKCPP